MICSNCGCPIPASEKFCRNCGSPAPEQQSVSASQSCPQCGGAMRYDEAGKLAKCPHCGYEEVTAVQKTDSVSLTNARLEQLRSSGSFKAQGEPRSRGTDIDSERLANAAKSALSGVGKKLLGALLGTVIALVGLGLLIYAAVLFTNDNDAGTYVGAAGLIALIVGLYLYKFR